MSRLVLFNKPFGVLCQFTGEPGQLTLADFIAEKGVYPAGRLDKDSEGLLLLTDDGKLQHRIANPKEKMAKTYWVQIEGDIDDRSLQAMRDGIRLKDGLTKPARAKRIAEPHDVWPRNPPIRVRKTVPDCWIELILRDGKNRQIRRMTAATGHPTLRLIRAQIGPWRLGRLQPGEWMTVDGSIPPTR